MGKRPKYYRRGEEFLALTGESPKGFKGVLFVCLKGDSPGDIKEDVVDKNRLREWKKVPADEVPEDWFAAFGLEKRKVVKPRLPTSDTSPTPQPILSQDTEWPQIVALVYVTFFAIMLMGWLLGRM